MSSPLDGLRRLAASATSLMLTRAEFASLELAQARLQLMRWLGLALAAAMLGMLGLIALSATVVVVLWPAFGWATLAGLAVAYVVVTFWLVRRLQREVQAAPPLLEQTLVELARDREAFLGSPSAAERTPAT